MGLEAQLRAEHMLSMHEALRSSPRTLPRKSIGDKEIRWRSEVHGEEMTGARASEPHSARVSHSSRAGTQVLALMKKGGPWSTVLSSSCLAESLEELFNGSSDGSWASLRPSESPVWSCQDHRCWSTSVWIPHDSVFDFLVFSGFPILGPDLRNTHSSFIHL